MLTNNNRGLRDIYRFCQILSLEWKMAAYVTLTREPLGLLICESVANLDLSLFWTQNGNKLP